MGTVNAYDAESRSLELLKRQYQTKHDEFAGQMRDLAAFCEQNSFFSDAEQIRQRASDLQGKPDLDELPNRVLPPLSREGSPVELQWRTKLRSLEEQYAIDLYQLARRAIAQRHASFAYQLVRELVYHNPDHDKGRELLGFVRHQGEWTTPFSRTMQVRGFVDHPEFGWIPKINVERYEKGERLFNGRWMPIEKEAVLRREFRNGWEIETEHFAIKTNHSLEKGVEIGRRLELFHRFFMREYAAFFSTPLQMQKLFGAGAVTMGTQRDRHQIYYFSNREEFVEVLKAKQQGVLIATGFYLPQERTSFFYYDDDPQEAEANQETIFHEVTHQLLGESSRKRIDVGERNNFWVIEGIACYMESFDIDIPQDGSAEPKMSIGDPTHPRIYWARHKALVDSYYVPLERFVLYGKTKFQSAPDNDTLHAWYSQSTGLVHFFMHYQDGIYRDAFIDYLSQVYSPIDRVRTNPESLEVLTGVPFSTLDTQYLEYLESLPKN